MTDTTKETEKKDGSTTLDVDATEQPTVDNLGEAPPTSPPTGGSS